MADTLPDTALLGIYLNDHLAGATAGTELAKRLAAAERGQRGEAVLSRLAEEVADDRAALLTCMAALEVPVRRYKTVAAWAGEKLGRLKPNGRLVSRSPLSAVEELELMRLGVEGKAAGWRTLRVRADADPRLDGGRLDDLIDRARRQIDELEDLRVHATAAAFGG
ncbi:hypothetical protein [Amycolatopsis sp. BJA-103]|uniref:hypothetical protein n=1 Tax=Amycolatopsis sp. BJA-103 TaxID=1911175 RepID=UPI000C77A91C|nr:hypothetical protein [Amycolatopsis sp. BJA-103]AUI64386.1 hypothetical protein BKN51_12000 [Amycolatopsis sp. BJA-103]PNE17881.1 hypothetical protein B1H26_22565 [Amycolatopsis sp. BJA-103]